MWEHQQALCFVPSDHESPIWVWDKHACHKDQSKCNVLHRVFVLPQADQQGKVAVYNSHSPCERLHETEDCCEEYQSPVLWPLCLYGSQNTQWLMVAPSQKHGQSPVNILPVSCSSFVEHKISFCLCKMRAFWLFKESEKFLQGACMII